MCPAPCAVLAGGLQVCCNYECAPQIAVVDTVRQWDCETKPFYIMVCHKSDYAAASPLWLFSHSVKCVCCTACACMLSVVQKHTVADDNMQVEPHLTNFFSFKPYQPRGNQNLSLRQLWHSASQLTYCKIPHLTEGLFFFCRTVWPWNLISLEQGFWTSLT